jgi:hypothetical protein
MRQPHSNTGLVITFSVLGLIAALMLIGGFIVWSRSGMESDAPPPAVPADDETNTPQAIPTDIASATSAPTETLPPTPTQLPSATTVPPTEAPAPTVVGGATVATEAPGETVNIYLIAVGDNGASGPPAGCGDSLVAVPRTIPAQASDPERITAALNELLDIDTDSVDGYSNVLAPSRLEVNSVEIEGGTARVALSGDLRIGEDCNASRIEAQLEGTIAQFAGITAVEVTINGERLEDVLYEG